VGWSQIVFGALLVAILLLLSGYYGKRQFVVLRRLRHETLPGEENRHERLKAYRRLVSCGLLLVLGLLLAGVLLWLEPATQRILDDHKGEPAPVIYAPDELWMIRVWGGSWVAILVLLLVVVALAAVDLWSTRGHALRQFRKLQADRRAMIQRQTGRLREERDQQT
jgi:hypothetical protein